jgi:hypothetical protein
MKIENGFDVPLAPADAWRVLLDIERIAPCMPGAELLETLGENAYKGRLAVKLGPVAVSFVGTARFEAIDEAARSMRVKAGGSDEKGRGGAQATVEFALVERAPGTTHVAIVTDLALNGAVAQYGRGAAMIQDMAQQMVGRFATNLRRQIEESGAAAASATAPPLGAPPVARAPAKPVSGLALFLGALWRALKRMVGG